MKTYRTFTRDKAAPGSLVIKLYNSGNQIRGYVRKLAALDEDDTIFPGEEMDPEAAFMLAESHARGDGGHAILVELAEDVEWDPAWGVLAKG
jgi:hypothetical protein